MGHPPPPDEPTPRAPAPSAPARALPRGDARHGRSGHGAHRAPPRVAPQQPMHATAGGKKLARALREPMPERGQPFEKLLRLLFGRVIPASLNTASPGYLAYIPGGGLFHAAVADLIADATNRYVGVCIAAPGLVQIEENVIQWFCAMIGLPGVRRRHPDHRRLARQPHRGRHRPPRAPPARLPPWRDLHVGGGAPLGAKAALLAGLLPERVRAVPTDDRFRLAPEALAAGRDAEDRAAGLSPFLVVASAGTTSTGASTTSRRSPISPRARACGSTSTPRTAASSRSPRAAGGPARHRARRLDDARPRTRRCSCPMARAASLVRDREALRRAHAVPASYLPPMQSDEGLVDFCELGPELSRDARGLRVWLPLAMHGAGVFRAALDEKLDLARWAADALRRMRRHRGRGRARALAARVPGAARRRRATPRSRRRNRRLCRR